MSKKKPITLRLSPEMHEELEAIARDLFLTVNNLLNQMLAASLPQFKVEGLLVREATQQTGKLVRVMKAWQAANPKRPRKEFLGELRKHLLGEPSSLNALPVEE